MHHMDVVPVTDSQWTVPAFQGLVKDGYIYGRGAIDMKGHGIIQLMALIVIKRSGIQLDRDLVYIGNADEEVNGDGAIVFVKRHPDLLRDVGIPPHRGRGYSGGKRGKVRWFGIDVGEKRPLWTRLVVEGKTSHGSVPIGNQNPVPRLARAIERRVSAGRRALRLTPAVEGSSRALATVESSPEGRKWLADPGTALKSPAGRAWLVSEPERNALLRNTISPTVLVGSNKTNTIPSAPPPSLISGCCRTRTPSPLPGNCAGSSRTPVSSWRKSPRFLPAMMRRSTPSSSRRSSRSRRDAARDPGGDPGEPRRQ